MKNVLRVERCVDCGATMLIFSRAFSFQDERRLLSHHTQECYEAVRDGRKSATWDVLYWGREVLIPLEEERMP